MTVISTVTQSLHIQSLMQTALETTIDVLGVDAGRLYVLDEKSQVLRLAAYHGLPVDQVSVIERYAPGEGIIGKTFVQNRPTVFADMANDPNYAAMSRAGTGRRWGFRSAAGIPITIKEKPVGVIYVYGRTIREFTSRDMELLSAIGGQIGFATENARLYEESRRSTEEQRALREFLSNLLLLDLDELLQRMTEQAALLFKAEYAWLRLFDDEGRIVTRAVAGDEEVIRLMSGQKEKGHLVGRGRWMLDNRKPLAITDMAQDIDRSSRGIAAGLHGFLGAPLFSRDQKPLGVLHVMTRSPREFSQGDLDLIEQFSKGAAIAIEKARLFQDAERRAREQEAVNVIATATGQSLDLMELFEIAADKTVEVTGRRRINFRLRDPLTGKVNIVAYRGFTEEEVTQLRGMTPHPMSEQVFASGNPLVINDRGAHHSPGLLAKTQSVAWIPVKAGTRVVGVLGVSDDQSKPFSTSEVALLQAIGNVIGVAIDNARLFEQVRKKSNELESLVQINRDVAGLLDKETLLPKIAQEAKRILNADGALFRLVEGDGLVLASVSDPQFLAFRRRLGLTQGLAGRIVQENRVLSIKNILQDSTILEEHQEFALKAGYRSFLGVPLRLGHRVIGVLNFYSKEERDFQPDEIALITAFADQAAIAIHNARLYEETQTSRSELESINQRLERLLEEQAGLYAALTPLAPADTLNQMLEKVIERLMEATGADAALIRLRDSSTGEFTYAAQRGFSDHFLEVLRSKSTGSAIGQIFDSGEPIIVSDIAADPRVKAKLQVEVGFRSCVFLPLKVRNQVRGVVLLSSRESGHFDAEQEAHLVAIVRQMGIAMENRELFDEIHASRAELARSNAELEQFAYVASHDLQEPLRMVASYMKLLDRRYKGKLDDDANEYIAFAVDGANRMQALINSLLDYSRIGTKGHRFEPTDCEKVLETALKNLHVPIEESKAIVTHHSLPTVMGDTTQLGQLFQNLIGNAIKFRGDKPPAVHVSAERNGKEWIFSFRDEGIGIDPQHSERIFVIFQRLHDKEEYPGTGIGLAVCKKIVERHGGRIWVESEQGKGSTFYFSLPLDS